MPHAPAAPRQQQQRRQLSSQRHRRRTPTLPLSYQPAQKIGECLPGVRELGLTAIPQCCPPPWTLRQVPLHVHEGLFASQSRLQLRLSRSLMQGHSPLWVQQTRLRLALQTDPTVQRCLAGPSVHRLVAEQPDQSLLTDPSAHSLTTGP